MDNSKLCISACAWLITALVSITCNFSMLQASETGQQQYPETTTVLLKLYQGEIIAGYRYKIYAAAAKEEGYENISHMLTAMSASEAIHAKNFKRILLSLGVKTSDVDISSIRASTTKNNLKFATEVELAEIDKQYPQYLKQLRSEKHTESIENVTYAWQSEKQHRELIKEVRSGTGLFFNMLLNHFRSNPSRYYVNQVCGATVTELPKGKCPICHHPLDTYLEIAKP